MSIVIKKDQMHVLDANGNEVAVNVLAEQKTSDVIAEIESAGTKAKAALTTQETASKNAITTQGNTVSQAITTQANQISQNLNSQYGDLAAEKVNEINDTNKTSTSKYPSVKAVADYVESETATTKDNLTKLEEAQGGVKWIVEDGMLYAEYGEE